MSLLPTIKDSRGRESHTLMFVSVAIVSVIVKFIFAGLTLPGLGLLPQMEVSEFGMAFAAIMAVWLGREWTTKPLEKSDV